MAKLPQPGRPIGRGEKRKAEDELTDNPSTKYNRERVEKLTPEERVAHAARHADNQNWVYHKKKFTSTPEYLNSSAEEQQRMLTKTYNNWHEKRHGKGIDAKTKIGNTADLVRFYQKDGVEEGTLVTLEENQDTFQSDSLWKPIKERINMKTQIAPSVDLEEHNDEDIPASDVGEDDVHRAEAPEWRQKDMKQPHEDEEHLVKERYGDEDMQAYPGKLDTQSREELNEDKAYLLWTEKCDVWVSAIGTVKQKLDYICDYIDTFEGNYQDLMRSGLLEDIVEMVPECSERFLAFLDDRDNWDIGTYRIERWYGSDRAEGERMDERVDEKSEIVEAKEEELEADTTGEAAAGVIFESVVRVKDGKDAEVKEEVGNVEQYEPQAVKQDVEKVEQNDRTAEQPEDVAWGREKDQEIDYSYRNDKNFYIPVPCLFTRAEMSVLRNMASHIEGFELGELGVWPPTLSLQLSQIMPDRDAGSAKKAWNMVVGLGYDEDGNLPAFEVMTEDMLNLSADVHILTIKQ